MNFTSYILHPEQLGRDTLYELRSYVALYPYNQVARLLMLRNLYLLHDSSFDDELRRAAFYITNRSVLFNLVEGKRAELRIRPAQVSKPKTQDKSDDRTSSLINDFLASLPEEEPVGKKKKPSIIDATTDYATYLLSLEEEAENDGQSTANALPDEPKANSNQLIDSFLDSGGKITLSEEEKTDFTPHEEVELENDRDSLDEGYYTETLAKIYIKQGKYSDALEIFKHINLDNPKKSVYFADQMRFLEKIILIKNKNKQ